ncbi:MAG: thiamine biosynthesis ThiH [Erysipelotrichaceae bacterium]|nr:MAG: thiamine biosynthesis ThiH [Erysipelotrichaceae bacterium]
METFIQIDHIEALLKHHFNPTESEVLSALNHAKEGKGLTYDEIAVLLNTEDEILLQQIFKTAGEIKDKIYGNRVVLFAPLYISDYCKNNCTYCGYKRDNIFPRRKLSREEIHQEVKVLEALGHKRLALEVGEDEDNCPFDYFLDAIDWIYEAGDIRRINVNIAATTVDNYKRLHGKKIGTYILFQETYHRPTYEKLHPQSLKGDYERQLYAHHRAMEGGIEDVGGGVLYGLYPNWKFEVLAQIMHNEDLERTSGVGFHTISIPRLKKAVGMELDQFEKGITDFEFKRIVTILRLALPYTGMILSTRETQEIRTDLIHHGISQVSAGSQTGVGSYSESQEDSQVTTQFEVSDDRSPIEVIKSLLKMDFLPSYCTACYRMGRTGDAFMEIVKAGRIGEMCHPNALMTLNEYCLQYGDDELRKLVDDFTQKELALIKNLVLKAKVTENIRLIKLGVKDLYV